MYILLPNTGTESTVLRPNSPEMDPVEVSIRCHFASIERVRAVVGRLIERRAVATQKSPTNAWGAVIAGALLGVSLLILSAFVYQHRTKLYVILQEYSKRSQQQREKRRHRASQHKQPRRKSPGHDVDTESQRIRQSRHHDRRGSEEMREPKGDRDNREAVDGGASGGNGNIYTPGERHGSGSKVPTPLVSAQPGAASADSRKGPTVTHAEGGNAGGGSGKGVGRGGQGSGGRTRGSAHAEAQASASVFSLFMCCNFTAPSPRVSRKPQDSGPANPASIQQSSFVFKTLEASGVKGIQVVRPWKAVETPRPRRSGAWMSNSCKCRRGKRSRRCRCRKRNGR